MRLVPPKGGRKRNRSAFVRVAVFRLRAGLRVPAEREAIKMSKKKESGDERRTGEVQFPNSRRIYVEGQGGGVRVPFREVSLQPTRQPGGRVEENEPVRVYETAGPWAD